MDDNNVKDVLPTSNEEEKEQIASVLGPVKYQPKVRVSLDTVHLEKKHQCRSKYLGNGKPRDYAAEDEEAQKMIDDFNVALDANIDARKAIEAS